MVIQSKQPTSDHQTLATLRKYFNCELIITVQSLQYHSYTQCPKPHCSNAVNNLFTVLMCFSTTYIRQYIQIWSNTQLPSCPLLHSNTSSLLLNNICSYGNRRTGLDGKHQWVNNCMLGRKIRCQSRAGSGRLGVKSPAGVRASGRRGGRAAVWSQPVMDLSPDVRTHHRVLLFTNCTHTKPDTKSILQWLLFNNAQGRVEGCHIEKIGSSNRRTGSGCLQRHMTGWHNISRLHMEFTHSVPLITEEHYQLCNLMVNKQLTLRRGGCYYGAFELTFTGEKMKCRQSVTLDRYILFGCLLFVSQLVVKNATQRTH